MQNSIFVPFSEELLAMTGEPLGELVPYSRSYECVRLLDGTFEFIDTTAPSVSLELHRSAKIGHAA